MQKKLSEKLEYERKFVTKCILKGQTISQIASKLGCSTSTVSNRISALFSQYKAKSRCEFVLNVLADVIKKDRETLRTQELLIQEKDNELNKLNTAMFNLFNIQSDKQKLSDYILRLKNNFKK